MKMISESSDALTVSPASAHVLISSSITTTRNPVSYSSAQRTGNSASFKLCYGWTYSGEKDGTARRRAPSEAHPNEAVHAAMGPVVAHEARRTAQVVSFGPLRRSKDYLTEVADTHGPRRSTVFRRFRCVSRRDRGMGLMMGRGRGPERPIIHPLNRCCRRIKMPLPVPLTRIQTR